MKTVRRRAARFVLLDYKVTSSVAGMPRWLIAGPVSMMDGVWPAWSSFTWSSMNWLLLRPQHRATRSRRRPLPTVRLLVSFLDSPLSPPASLPTAHVRGQWRTGMASGSRNGPHPTPLFLDTLITRVSSVQSNPRHRRFTTSFRPQRKVPEKARLGVWHPKNVLNVPPPPPPPPFVVVVVVAAACFCFVFFVLFLLSFFCWRLVMVKDVNWWQNWKKKRSVCAQVNRMMTDACSSKCYAWRTRGWLALFKGRGWSESERGNASWKRRLLWSEVRVADTFSGFRRYFTLTEEHLCRYVVWPTARG